ncbi:MAG: hypothetical protein LBU94_05830, partial [Clostridiales bacterium]|nr:hypothetical protein [Clostridiales bacterium]
MQKRLMAINDLSCYGRCAMTVTLPVLSSAGVECSVRPTAVLSTHLAYPNPPKADMTDMLKQITRHLKGLNISFDAIAS